MVRVPHWSLLATCVVGVVVALCGMQCAGQTSLSVFGIPDSSDNLIFDLPQHAYTLALPEHQKWAYAYVAIQGAVEDQSASVLIKVGTTIQLAPILTVSDLTVDARRHGSVGGIFEVRDGDILDVENVTIYGGYSDVGGVLHMIGGQVNLRSITSIGASAGYGGFAVVVGGELVIEGASRIERSTAQFDGDYMLVGGSASVIGNDVEFVAMVGSTGVVISSTVDQDASFACIGCDLDGVGVKFEEVDIASGSCAVGLGNVERFVANDELCATSSETNASCPAALAAGGVVTDTVTCEYVCPSTFFMNEMGQCVACTVCGEGYTILSECKIDQDTLCSAQVSCPEVAAMGGIRTNAENCDYVCQSEYYMADTGECTECTTCGNGEYLQSACSDTQDTMCSSCPDAPFNAVVTDILACEWTCTSGFFEDNGACTPCSTCGGGQLLFAVCTDTTDTQCVDCYGNVPENGYFAGYDIVTDECAWACNQGYYSAGDSCVECRACGVDQLETGAGCEGEVDRECIECVLPIGAVRTNFTTCDFVCEADRIFSSDTDTCDLCVVPDGGVRTNATTCEFECVGASMLDNTSGLCTMCTVPTNGYIMDADTCTAGCNNGFFWQDASSTCEPCMACGSHAVVGTPCGATSDTVCMPCPVSGAVYTAQGSCEYECAHGSFFNGSSCVTCSGCPDAEVPTGGCTTEMDTTCGPAPSSEPTCDSDSYWDATENACVVCGSNEVCPLAEVYDVATCTQDGYTGSCVCGPDTARNIDGVCQDSLLFTATVYMANEGLIQNDNVWYDYSGNTRDMAWSSTCSAAFGGNSNGYTLRTTANGLFVGAEPDNKWGCFSVSLGSDAFSMTGTSNTWMIVAEASVKSALEYSDTWANLTPFSEVQGAFSAGWSTSNEGMHTWGGEIDDVGDGLSGLAYDAGVYFFQVEDGVGVRYMWYNPGVDAMVVGYDTPTRAAMPTGTTCNDISLLQLPYATSDVHGVLRSDGLTSNVLGEAAFWEHVLTMDEMLRVSQRVYNKLLAT